MSELKTKVIDLLKSYPSKKRQIEQLRFELEHPAFIGEKELIDSLSFGSDPMGAGARSVGHVSNKTMAIALQYQDVMQRMNNESISDIVCELRALESEVDRLEHYISLLSEQESRTIRLLYFEQKSWIEVEREMSVSKRTILNYRASALNELMSMYLYLDKVKGNSQENSG